MVLGTAGCENKQLTRMEQNQARLQAMVAANARQPATISAQVRIGNTEVQESLVNLDQNNQTLRVGITGVQKEQARLHETVAAGNAALDKRMTALDGNLRVLQEGVTQVAGIAQCTASDVTAIAREQATLHQMVQSKTRGQTADIISAIEHLRQPAPDLKISDSSVKPAPAVAAAVQTEPSKPPAPEVTANNPDEKLESSVAEAAAK